MSRPIYEAIKTKLTAALNPSLLEIIDNSHLHASHAAMRDAKTPETHFKVIIVSKEFENKRRVARHQLVYKVLEEEFKAGLHAFEMETKTEEEMTKE